jgi:hypothetical protein
MFSFRLINLQLTEDKNYDYFNAAIDHEKEFIGNK